MKVYIVICNFDDDQMVEGVFSSWLLAEKAIDEYILKSGINRQYYKILQRELDAKYI